MKLKKGDEVKIVGGKDAGKTGAVEKVYTKEDKVLVSGVNQYKRHMKSRMQGQASEIITITKPLPVAQVALICPTCKKQTRIGYLVERGKKVRVCKKCDSILEK
jgi:large subunit ribosomal protein L24